MIYINSAFLSYLPSALTGGADIDELIHEYYNTNANDPEIMKNIIRTVLMPVFESYPDLFKLKSKDCLGYYLSTGKINFEEIFDGNLLPFNPPEDSKLFYTWIWEIFFENENYNTYNTENCLELYDFDEPMNCLISSKNPSN